MNGIRATRLRADGERIGPCVILGFVWDGARVLAVAADEGMRRAPLYVEYADNFEVDLAMRPIVVPAVSNRVWWERLLGR